MERCFRMQTMKPQNLAVTDTVLVMCNDRDPVTLSLLKRMKDVDVVMISDDNAMMTFIEENASLPDCALLAVDTDGTKKL